jgi:hypothetical protein
MNTFHSRVTEGSYHFSLFLLFLEVQSKQQLIFPIWRSIGERKPDSIKKLSGRLRRFYLVIRMLGANDFQQIPWSSTFSVTGPQISVMGCQTICHLLPGVPEGFLGF